MHADLPRVFAWLKDDAPQTCMRVDDACMINGYNEMMLGQSQRDQQHIAGPDRVGRRFQSGTGCEGEPLADTDIAHSIARWRHGLPAASRQSCAYQTNAIEPGCRITAMQPETAPDERARGFCQSRTGGRHDCP